MPNIGDIEYEDTANLPGMENTRGIQQRVCLWAAKNYSCEGLIQKIKDMKKDWDAAKVIALELDKAGKWSPTERTKLINLGILPND